MQTAIGQVGTAHSDIQQQRQLLAGYASDLAGGWQSTASSAFQSAFEAFDGEMQKLLAALNNIQNNLQVNHNNYQNVEDTNQSVVNKVAGAINA
jgi:WXG100 family type VII secretion target